MSDAKHAIHSVSGRTVLMTSLQRGQQSRYACLSVLGTSCLAIAACGSDEAIAPIKTSTNVEWENSGAVISDRGDRAVAMGTAWAPIQMAV